MRYDYSCRECKHGFEVEMKIAELDTKKIRCPLCKSSKTRRAYVKPATIRFKGSGFYVNDSKGK